MSNYKVEILELTELVNILAKRSVLTANMIENHGEALRRQVLANVIAVTGDNLYEGFLLGELVQEDLELKMQENITNYVTDTFNDYLQADIYPAAIFKVSESAISVLKFEGKDAEYLHIFNKVVLDIQLGLL